MLVVVALEFVHWTRLELWMANVQMIKNITEQKNLTDVRFGVRFVRSCRLRFLWWTFGITEIGKFNKTFFGIWEALEATT